MRRDDTELDAMRDEFKCTTPRRCRDMTCGAEDCPTCYPASWDLTEDDDETTTAEKGETHV